MVIGYIAGILMIPKVLSQKTLLTVSALSGIIFTAFALVIPSTAAIHIPFLDLMKLTRVELTLPYTVLFIALLGLSNAIVWPAIWPLAIHGLGKFIKTGSALLIMAIAGGAILPLIWGYLSNVWSAQMAYSIAIPCYMFILYYAVYGHKVRKWK
jgi:fucose permease